MMGGAIEIDAFVILYPETYIVTCFSTASANVFMPKQPYGTSTSSERTFHLFYFLPDDDVGGVGHYDFLEPEEEFMVGPAGKKMERSPYWWYDQSKKDLSGTPPWEDESNKLKVHVKRMQDQARAAVERKELKIIQEQRSAEGRTKERAFKTIIFISTAHRTSRC
jgi:hypothetical protein